MMLNRNEDGREQRANSGARDGHPSPESYPLVVDHGVSGVLVREEVPRLSTL